MRYRLAIVGGGPAGYSAALEATRLGLSVVLFERDLAGGTCLNRGCVPTKFLAEAAHAYDQARDGARYGIRTENAAIDPARMQQRKGEIVTELREGLEQLLARNKVTVVRGAASMTDAAHIFCTGNTYEADNILIATGSVPAAPLVEGALTSDELLELDYVPEKLRIIGGGVIAAEFACIYNALGAKVTLSIRGKRILRRWDREIAVGLTQIMRKRGIGIETECDLDRFAEMGVQTGSQEEQVPGAGQSPEKIRQNPAEIVLSAAGRIPGLDGVDKSYLEIGPSGGIVADEYGRTKTPGIFAAGDVVEGSPQLAHVGMEQGKRVAQYIAGLPLSHPSAVASCIYTDPEIASVGLTEAQAKEDGVDVVSAKVNLRANARTLISTDDRGFVKLLAQKDTGRLLGAQLMCGRATDLAAELVLAVNQGLTAEELCRSVRPHPSYCEAVTEAAESLRNRINEI